MKSEAVRDLINGLSPVCPLLITDPGSDLAPDLKLNLKLQPGSRPGADGDPN